MRVLRPILIGSLVLSVVFGAVAPSAGADAVTDAGVSWLDSQQLEDGSFELLGFPPFETPDAVLAIAANAQTTDTWDPAEALAAVQAVENGGVTAVEWLDDFAEAGLDAGLSAKFALLVAAPLGEDPRAFDPDGDGDPVDLTAGLDDIPVGLFNSFLFGRLAEAELGENVHQRDVQVICEAQKSTGGWSFDGVATSDVATDLDTTGFATMALVAAGIPVTDPVLLAAEPYVGGQQQASGAFPSFGSDDPNATALALMAWTALGNVIGDLDFDAVAWLQDQQLTSPPEEAGRFQSPNDGFPLPGDFSTFATSQAVQALLLDQDGADWLPRPAADSGRRCLPASTYVDLANNAWYDDGARYVDDTDIVAGFNGTELRPKQGVNRAQASEWLNLFFGDAGGPATSFSDVPANAWYRDGVDFVGDAPNGVIATGFSDNTFRPKETLNRGQAVAWLYNAVGAPDVSGLQAHGLTDLPVNAWYGDAVTWAVANGVVTGFADMTFRPKDPVNRAQFSQWLFNVAATPEAWDGPTIPELVLFSAP